jgi:hypothetical protein
MLLHAPNASGFSSPVGGQDGAVPIRGAGVPIGPETLAAPEASAQSAARTIDFGWIATRVARPVIYGGTPVRAPIIGSIGPTAMHLVSPTSELPLPSTPAAQTSSQSASYAAVLAMLHGWEKDEHGAR